MQLLPNKCEKCEQQIAFTNTKTNSLDSGMLRKPSGNSNFKPGKVVETQVIRKLQKYLLVVIYFVNY